MPTRVLNSLIRLAASAAAVSILTSAPAFAASVTLTTGDAVGTSSFNAAGNWSVAAAPSAGNTYTDTNTTLRTPSDAVSHTFAGDSLTLGNNSSTGSMGFKGFGVSTSGADDTITVLNLIANKGVISNSTGGPFFLAGNINIQAGGLTLDMQVAPRTVNVVATMSGAGALTATTSGGTLGAGFGTIYLDASNSFTGGTTVKNLTILDVQHDGGLGSGAVSVLSGGELNLDSGTTNNYIADSANLLIATGIAAGSVGLNFTGTDIIGGLSLNGGTTFLANGTYGAIGSAAQNTNAAFTGSGLLQVGPSAAPEPASLGIALMGLAAAPLLRRSSRRRRALA